MKKIFITILSLSTLFITLESCRESDLNPTLAQQKDIDTAINDVQDVSALVNSAYSLMSTSSYYGRDYIIYGEVRSDNAFSNGNSNRFVSVAQFNLTADNRDARDTWSTIYRVIANANIVISKQDTGISGDQNLLKQLVGEAYALRALSHFDLLKLYSQYNVGNGGMSSLGVPYVTTFKDIDNIYPSRNSVQEVYDLAMSDLNKAIGLLNQNRGNAYLSKSAAYALKARIALYFKQYDEAKAAAKNVIDMGGYSIVSANGFKDVFVNEMASAQNVIFGIENTANDNPDINGLANIYGGSSYGDIEILGDLFNVYDAGDVRRSEDMIKVENNTYRNVGKYSNFVTNADDIPLIRYEEVVLIYAEALLKTGNTSDALIWLNKVPAMRGASTYTTASLENILLERRKEFAFEGFRFFDLLRTGNAIPKIDTKQNFTATIQNGNPNLAFPIPNAEVDANSNVSQNEGY